MNQSSFLIAVFSFAILLAMGLLFLYLHLRSVREEAVGYWKIILDKMRIRNDMMPGLIETVRKYTGKDSGEEKLLGELIALRAKSWPMEHATGQKVNVELRLTQELHAVWKLPQRFSALNVDTNFLSLKKDFHDLGKEIDAMVDVYNKKVRGFNGGLGLLVMRPFLAVAGLKKLAIFEFEV